MEPVILDQIPFDPTPEHIEHVLDTKVGKSSQMAIERLVEETREIAKPKAMYRVLPCQVKGEEGVEIGGVLFKSRVLRVNLEDIHRVFAFVVTCGQELQAWQDSIESTLENYYADVVNGMALTIARDYLADHLEERYQLGKIATMNPGSLNNWPIRAQISLFELLGDPEKSVGVRLLDSLLMNPSQSVSGIRFQTDSDYVNCQLCPRLDCPHRKAPYDQDLYQKRFA